MDATKNYKITIFGDSIPKGVVFEDNQIKKLPQGVVDIIAKYYGLSIKNVSVFGQTLKRIYDKNIIDEYIENLDRTEENVVVISIGGNDSDFDWKEVAKSPLAPHSPKTPIDEFSDILDISVKRLKKVGVKVLLTTIPPIESSLYFENVISNVADKDNVLKFLHNDLSNIYRQQECYNLEIVKCAVKNKCPLIDIRPDFLLDRTFLDDMCKDGVHPNEKGHFIMAKHIINMIDNGEI